MSNGKKYGATGKQARKMFPVRRSKALGTSMNTVLRCVYQYPRPGAQDIFWGPKYFYDAAGRIGVCINGRIVSSSLTCGGNCFKPFAGVWSMHFGKPANSGPVRSIRVAGYRRSVQHMVDAIQPNVSVVSRPTASGSTHRADSNRERMASGVVTEF